jgi:hypothetical protein
VSPVIGGVVAVKLWPSAAELGSWLASVTVPAELLTSVIVVLNVEPLSRWICTASPAPSPATEASDKVLALVAPARLKVVLTVPGAIVVLNTDPSDSWICTGSPSFISVADLTEMTVAPAPAPPVRFVTMFFAEPPSDEAASRCCRSVSTKSLPSEAWAGNGLVRLTVLFRIVVIVSSNVLPSSSLICTASPLNMPVVVGSVTAVAPLNAVAVRVVSPAGSGSWARS